MEHNSMILPVSGAHLQLLDIMLLLSMLMFISYAAVLLGSSLLSVNFRKKALKESNPFLAELAKDTINLATSVPTIWFSLGIAPLIAVIILYYQLLGEASTDVVTYLTLSLLFLVGGIASAYAYKNSLNTNSLLNRISQKSDDLVESLDFNTRLNKIAGFWAKALLILSIFFFFAGNIQASNKDLWDVKVLGVLFDSATLWQTLHAITGAYALAAISFVYFNFIWSGGRTFESNEYKAFARTRMAKIAMWFIIFQPIFFAYNVTSTPQEGLSASMFVFAAISMICIFVAVHQLYATIKEGKESYLSLGFWMFLIPFFMMVAKEHNQFSTSNKVNLMSMAASYDKMEAERHAAESGVEIEVNAEEIYKNRCSACHKFDQKQATAPAYNEVVPKYLENQEELTKFILNPYPVNKAEYPQGMANQGLKPAEAKAMSKWLIEKLGGGAATEATQKVEVTEEAKN